MSSYNQVDETNMLGQMMNLARKEIVALEDEMADLCNTIRMQFPNKYKGIPKCQQAYAALMTLVDATVVLGQSLPDRTMETPITVKVGRQTRQNRSTSQRVRLGNAVVRLRGVAEELQKNEHPSLMGLDNVIEKLDAVTFPMRYG